MPAICFSPNFPGDQGPLVRLRETLFPAACVVLDPEVVRYRIGSAPNCEILISDRVQVGKAVREKFSRIHTEARYRDDHGADNGFWEITNGYCWPGTGYQPSSNGLWVKKKGGPGVWLPNRLDPIRLDVGDRIVFGRGVPNAQAIIVKNCKEVVDQKVWADNEWPKDVDKREPAQVNDPELYGKQLTTAHQSPKKVAFKLGPAPWYAQVGVLVIENWSNANTGSRLLTLFALALVASMVVPGLVLAVVYAIAPLLD